MVKETETVVRDYDSYYRIYGELKYQSDKNVKALKKRVMKLKNSNKQLMERFLKKMQDCNKYSKNQLAEFAYKTLAKFLEFSVTKETFLLALEKDSYFRGVIKGCYDAEAIYNNCKVKINEVCLEEEDFEKMLDSD